MPAEYEQPVILIPLLDFEFTLQAARAVTAAPGWLSSLKDAELLRRVERMKAFLRDSKPGND